MSQMDQDAGDEGSSSLAKNRSRRANVGRTGHKAALERFKEARQGNRSKFDFGDERNVYEEVDEEEYSKIVRDRQDDDWIIDDGTGYVEDGREIFDDDVEDDNNQPASKKKTQRNGSKPPKNVNIRPNDSKPAGIRAMFAAAAVKPKTQKSVKLDDDDILGDIMGELKQAGSVIRPMPITLQKKASAGETIFDRTISKQPQLSKPRDDNRPIAAVPGRHVLEEKHRNVSNLQAESETSFGKRTVKHKTQPCDVTTAMPLKTSASKTSVVDKKHQSVKSSFSHQNDVETFDDMDISCFESQDVLGDCQPSQTIEDFEDPTDVENMDVSGIDFSENFDAEVEPDKVQKISQKPPQDVEKEHHKTLELLPSSGNDKSGLTEIINVDSSKLPLVKTLEGFEVMRMYWLDAFEDHIKQPGTVYLFGKVWHDTASAYVSCCLTVKNIERRVFLLPRKYFYDVKTKTEDLSRPVSLADVYEEFSTLSERYKIMSFKSMKVNRQYAFDLPDVPVSGEYLEVRYSADLPALRPDLCGATFSHVFATNASALETLLLDRKIKGPSWLDIYETQVTNPPISWCRLEATVSKPDGVRLSEYKADPPPLIVLSMSLRTAPHPKTQQNEIVVFSGLVHAAYPLDRAAPKPLYQSHFCAVSPPTNGIFPFDFRTHVKSLQSTRSGSVTNIEVIPSEQGLLGFVLAKLHRIDPDVIVGHDVSTYDFDILLHRIAACKVPHWSKLGRIKRAVMPKMVGRFGTALPAAGRLVLDVQISARELIRCRSYDLTELASHILKVQRQVYDSTEIRSLYGETRTLMKLIETTATDAMYSLHIAADLNALPLAAQITNICGNILSRTLAGGRSERNEYLLLHAFSERNFIVPDKTYGKKQPVAKDETGHDEDGFEDNDGGKKSKSSKRKPAYTGGLVLEPKRGFYDRFILLVDFNSLYPSIIQEYNICFTTVALSRNKTSEESDDFDESLLPPPGLEPGVLPTEIRRLVESRRQVRQLMKQHDAASDAYGQYDIRQRALKLTANSLYGCLGFSNSRFFARRLAALVTGKGREILMKTKDLVEAMNLNVIYGDTDSLMIATGCNDVDEVYRLGNKIKSDVNKLYRHLEIDIDGVFQSMLLLKKKKYAALAIERVGDKVIKKQEMKGLDIVRRDWCVLAKDAGTYIVGQILSGETRDAVLDAIHSRLEDIGNAVRDGTVPIESFAITKQLTKNPEDYPDRKSLPHVQVAMRLNSNSAGGNRKLRAGDTVAYVVCDDGSNLPATQRAYHLELEFNKRTDLKIDTHYYLEQQVHPVVARLCDPIEGTDAARIAQCLGLDPSGFHHSAHRYDDGMDDVLLGKEEESETEKYRDCQPLQFVCSVCSTTQFTIDSAQALVTSKCDKCNVGLLGNEPCIRNRLLLEIRRQISRYYEGWFTCDDVGCAWRTRRIPLVVYHGQPMCPVCQHSALRREITDKAIYTQLCYYRYLVDVDTVTDQFIDESTRQTLNRLKWDVDRVIGKSAFSQVDLGKLFSGLFPAN